MKRSRRKGIRGFLKEIRLDALRLNDLYERGKISPAAYERKMEQLDEQLNFLSSIVIHGDEKETGEPRS